MIFANGEDRDLGHLKHQPIQQFYLLLTLEYIIFLYIMLSSFHFSLDI